VLVKLEVVVEEEEEKGPAYPRDLKRNEQKQLQMEADTEAEVDLRQQTEEDLTM
jgi:hypothetical protein